MPVPAVLGKNCGSHTGHQPVLVTAGGDKGFCTAGTWDPCRCYSEQNGDKRAGCPSNRAANCRKLGVTVCRFRGDSGHRHCGTVRRSRRVLPAFPAQRGQAVGGPCPLCEAAGTCSEEWHVRLEDTGSCQDAPGAHRDAHKVCSPLCLLRVAVLLGPPHLCAPLRLPLPASLPLTPTRKYFHTREKESVTGIAVP